MSASEPKRISREEWSKDPGRWLKHSRDQQVIVEYGNRVIMVLGTSGENLFPDPPEDDDWWEDYEVDEDYEHDPGRWLR